MLVLLVLVGASPPCRRRQREVGVAPASRTLSGAEAVVGRRRGTCSQGHSDMTHEEKAECEWRASLVLRDLEALERRRLLGEKVHVNILRLPVKQSISFRHCNVTFYCRDINSGHT